MNVILVCESALLTGGAERVAILEALELRKRGIRVGFISGSPDADPQLAEAGVELLTLNTNSFFEETDTKRRLALLSSNPYILPEVREFLSKFPPAETILHIHSFRLKLSGSVIHLAQQLGYKTAFHCNEYGTICPTSLYYNHRQQQNCTFRPLSPGCLLCECQGHGQKLRHKLPKVTSHFANKHQLKIYDNANLFIAVSKLNQRTINPHLPKPATIVNYPHILPTPDEMGENHGEEFAFIGRLVPEKAPDTFLQAAKLAGIKAVVIGGGPMEESLRSAHPEARFTGWLKDQALKEEMKSIRALVVPSRWRETFGLSVVDAIHRGIPVIATTSVGASEVIRESGAGLVTEEITPESIAAAMQQLNQPETWTHMREKAFGWSKSNPRSTEIYVDKILELFEPLFK